MKQTEKNFLLKDLLFTKEKVLGLGESIKFVYPKLDKESFTKNVLARFPELELKERITHISAQLYTELNECLGLSYRESAKVLLKSLEGKDVKEDFIYAAYPQFIATYGCKDTDFKFSLLMLELFTPYFSAEFAIREFLNKFPDITFNVMLFWSKSEKSAVRRLASEGLRPRLPWGKNIPLDYKKGAQVLENLYFDNDRYVTRSVANHLNDISKIDPQFVINTLKRWEKECNSVSLNHKVVTGFTKAPLKEVKHENKQIHTLNLKEPIPISKQHDLDYIIKHSLRTLVKEGNKEALYLLGYSKTSYISYSKAKILNPSKVVYVGEKLNFELEIKNKGKSVEKVVLHYKVQPILTRQGKITNKGKVFLLKNLVLKKGQVCKIEKKHSFKLMTTRRLHLGKHQLQIFLNGDLISTNSFILRKKE